jgi:hypothetical protein
LPSFVSGPAFRRFDAASGVIARLDAWVLKRAIPAAEWRIRVTDERELCSALAQPR